MGKDAFYFSHDANAQRDPKILKLLQKHGWEGYGLFWAVVEMLRNEENFKLPTEYETYAFALRSHEDRIKSIVEDFDLFTVADGFFWSESLVRRMSIKNCKSEKARKSAMLRWSKKDDDANAMRTQCDGNAIKEKKEKENINTEEYSALFEEFWKEYPNKKGKDKAYTSWKKYKCENGLFDKIMQSLRDHIESDSWKKNNGQFIPHGSTWVNGKGWNDEPDGGKTDEWGHRG